MAEDTNSGVGPTQDGFASLDLLRVLRTPSMASIGQPSESVVFESFKQPDFFDRSQYAPQLGSSYTQAHDDPQEMQSEDDFYVQFDVVFTGDKKVSVTAGYVRGINPDAAADSPIIDWMPTLNGVPLSNDPAPEITVAAGQVLYCEVQTDPKGLIIETPTIVLGAPQDTGTHYQPFEKTPINGSLRYPIAEFEQSGDELVAVQKQQGGPIVVQPNLWEGRNIGGKREWYKERQNAGDYYEWRTAEQIEGDGVAIIEPLKEGSPEVPPVLNDEGVVVKEGTPAVPPEKEGSTIKWRTIDGRAPYSDPDSKATKQINVRERLSDKPDDDGIKRSSVEVVGNNYVTSETSVTKFAISIDDGLVTSFTKEDVATGKNLNLSIYYLDVSSLISGGTWTWAPSLKQKLYWRNGLYVGNTNPDVGGIPPAGLVEQDLFELTP
jgi:hypothetical protein